MVVLLTNDDGVKSKGLAILQEALREDHDVWVVAPDSERSGNSHAITLRNAVRFRSVADQVYSCDGTPADCVLYSYIGAIPVRPDVVVSGINHGPNIGTDIIYSGTVGAARQAALMGCPGVAVSAAETTGDADFGSAAGFVRGRLERLVANWKDEYFWNINVPHADNKRIRVSITHPARRDYNDRLIEFEAPTGDRYLFLTGDLTTSSEDPGSDWEAVSAGKISVSPIYLHPQKHRESPESDFSDLESQ